jgi:hypothetical protein
MLIEIQVSDQSVTIALITGATTVAVACIKAAAEVVIAWIQTLRPRPPPAKRDRAATRSLKGGPSATRSCARPHLVLLRGRCRL